jgi:hypothetical protein
MRHVLGYLGMNESDFRNVLVADYTDLNGEDHTRESLLNMSQEERNEIEERIAARIAHQLIERLPRTREEREALIDSGRSCARLMSWDSVIKDSLLPLFSRITRVDHAETSIVS